MQFISPTLTSEETEHILSTHIKMYETDSLQGRYAVVEKSTRAFIGTFVLKPSDAITGMEIGYAFLKQSWGKGYGTELVRAGLDFVFEKLGYKDLYAITEVTNEASKNILRKCGFNQLDNIWEHGKEVNLFRIEKQ